MAKTVHSFCEETRKRYLFGIFGLAFFGVIFMLVGLVMLSSLTYSGRYGASHPAFTGLALAIVGAALLWGARVPFARYAQAPHQRIEVDEAGLTWFDGGAPKSILWTDISFVDVTDTTLTLKTSTRGRLEIPADYQDFPHLIERVRRSAGC